MKKIWVALILLVLYQSIAQAQEPVTVHLPLVLKGVNMPSLIEKWKIIFPVKSTNYVLNPSAETTLNYSALGGATVTRSTTYQKYGNYSYRVQTGSNGQGVSLTLSTLPNENCFATFRAKGKLPLRLRIIIGTGLSTPLLIEKIDEDWNMYGALFSAAECNGITAFRIIQQGNGIGDFYVDGVQVENLEYWTSYIDGNQEGCAWNGVEHASTSTRSGLSRAGGQVKELFSDYGFMVEKVVGAGATNRDLAIDEYAFLPGGGINEIKIQSRQWSLIGKFIANSDDEIYENRKQLLTLIRNNPQKQPIKLLFYHPRGIREIKAFYAGGLEGDMSVFYDSWVTEEDDKWIQLNKYIEKNAIQLKSPDPYFYGQGNKSVNLDANDSATFRFIAARLKSTGQWSNLGPPNAAGTYGAIKAFAENDNYLYLGGIFSNFDNVPNTNNIVKYNKETGVYSALGTGITGGTVTVAALAIASNGDLYAAGNFTIAGGVPASNIARWNGSTWSALSSGINNGVTSLAIASNGDLYASGNFTIAGGVPASNIAKWNGSAWSALSSGINNLVNSLAFAPSGDLYASGNFTIAGGVPASNIAKWNGSAWSALSSGMNGTVLSVAVASDGILYAAGFFTIAGGVPANNIAKWNGSTWSALSSGINGPVAKLDIAPDDTLYAGGDFTTVGGGVSAKNIAHWNGYAWGHLDVNLPITALAEPISLMVSKYADPIVKQNYDLFVGFNDTGTGYFNAKTIITNDGSIDVFPIFTFKRIGGNTQIALASIRNETTGKELLFSYTLLDGERLTIDLTPNKKSIKSNYFGDRLDAILANSNFGDFVLETQSNDLTAFASGNFSLYPSSLESFVQWLEVYESYD